MKIGISLPMPFMAGLYTDEGSAALQKQNHTAGPLLEKLREKGASSIELRYWQKDMDIKTIADVFRKIKKAALEFTIHGEIDVKQENLGILESMPWIETGIDIAGFSSEKPLIITMHPVKIADNTTEENYKKTVSILSHLCREIENKKLPVLIAYENQRERGGPNPAVDYKDMVSAAREAESSSIGLCWDMGHAYSNFGRSLMAENPTPDFLGMLIHTHIHDLYPGTDSTHWPLTCGTVPVDNYVKLLKKSGYRGLYNLELSPEKFKDQDILGSFIKSMEILAASYGKA